MAQFTRRTILAAVDLVPNYHAEIDRFALEHGIEQIVVGPSLARRGIALSTYLIQNPDVQNEDGENLTDVLVRYFVAVAIERSTQGYPRAFDFESFQRNYPALNRGLERDGFTVEDGVLRRALPQVLDLPAADDEVHQLLDRYGFAVSRGHLDQGIAAHARGTGPRPTRNSVHS